MTRTWDDIDSRVVRWVFQEFPPSMDVVQYRFATNPAEPAPKGAAGSPLGDAGLDGLSRKPDSIGVSRE